MATKRRNKLVFCDVPHVDRIFVVALQDHVVTSPVERASTQINVIHSDSIDAAFRLAEIAIELECFRVPSLENNQSTTRAQHLP